LVQALPSAIEDQEQASHSRLAFSQILDDVSRQYHASDFCAKNRFEQAANL